MAAAIAFRRILVEPGIGIICSFLDESSVAATCSTDGIDVDALADVFIMAHCPSYTQTAPDWLVYVESLELEHQWIQFHYD